MGGGGGGGGLVEQIKLLKQAGNFCLDISEMSLVPISQRPSCGLRLLDKLH
jgi:hypothetical protein